MVDYYVSSFLLRISIFYGVITCFVIQIEFEKKFPFEFDDRERLCYYIYYIHISKVT